MNEILEILRGLYKEYTLFNQPNKHFFGKGNEYCIVQVNHTIVYFTLGTSVLSTVDAIMLEAEFEGTTFGFDYQNIEGIKNFFAAYAMATLKPE